MLNQSTTAPELEEDTLELELTAEQTQSLAQAAEKSRPEPAPPVVVALPSPQPRMQQAAPARFRLWQLVLVAAVVGASATLTWRATTQRTPHGAPSVVAPPAMTPAVVAAPTPVMHPTAPAVSPPAASAPASEAPLRIHNPFDRSEVFEFPAGTSKSDARAKVAAILFARAQDRRSQASAAAAAKKHAAKN